MSKFKRFLKSCLVSFFVLALLAPYVGDLITVETAQATFTLTVQVTGLSPTQAVLTYTAPDTNPCTIEVSQSSGYSPLVHDVDPTLFSGADSDSRSSSVTSDTQRIFVVGTRTIQLAQDGRKYSRAYPDLATYNSWHIPNDFSNVVPANTKDLTLPIGEYVKMRVVR